MTEPVAPPASATRDRALRALAHFALLAIALIATERWVTRSARFFELPGDVGALAVIFDLAICLPLVYWWVVVRRSKVHVATVVPVIALGLATAMLLLPDGHRDVARWARYALLPAELAVVWWGVRRVRTAMAASRATSGGDDASADPFVRLRQLFREVVPVRGVADVVAFECALLYYALFTVRSLPHIPPGARAFTTHRKSGVVALLLMGAVIAVVEAAVVHILVQRWSPALAWALTILSIYGVVWIIGFLQALRLRPILLTPRALVVRAGMLSVVEVPLDAIARIVPATFPYPDRGTPEYLQSMVSGDPQFLIELDRSLRAEGVYGRSRTVRLVGLAVDEPAEFRSALESRMAARS